MPLFIIFLLSAYFFHNYALVILFIGLVSWFAWNYSLFLPGSYQVCYIVEINNRYNVRLGTFGFVARDGHREKERIMATFRENPDASVLWACTVPDRKTAFEFMKWCREQKDLTTKEEWFNGANAGALASRADRLKLRQALK